MCPDPGRRGGKLSAFVSADLTRQTETRRAHRNISSLTRELLFCQQRHHGWQLAERTESDLTLRRSRRSRGIPVLVGDMSD